MENLQVDFKSFFVNSVGNGSKTLFWKEHWIGNDKLCNLFPRLFKLELDPDVSVRERMTLNAEGLFNWKWSRAIPRRAVRELEALVNILSSAKIDNGSVDKVLWSLDLNHGFSVKGLSKVIDDQLLFEFSSHQETIRNTVVPKKVELFAWRAIKKKLPIRVELDNRGIDLHSTRCPLCDDSLESVDHTLIFCSHAREIWERIFKWWNMGSFNYYTINELLVENNHSVPMSSIGNSIWLAIKWIGAYFIWKNRNNKVFRNKAWNGPVALNEIQAISYDWIANRLKGKNMDWLTWISNPAVYLNLV
ncbi:uncharacterized protein [Rutidosis leptorrhynchoides]|uniref:uncharacterized protein n=1 Tax=Rutidosis leptorrhynchoides TaxID=125765 RepID=UPI003A98F270